MHCTIKDLQDRIAQFQKLHPEVDLDSVGVSIERIHDVYFEKHNWSTVKRTWAQGTMWVDTTESISAFQPVFYPNEDGTYEMVIEAHY